MADETTQQAAPPVPATIPIPTTEPELPLIPLDESALNPEYDPAKDQRAPFLKTPINPTGPTISPAPTRSVGQVIKEAATENIPQFSSRTVSNPNYGKQSFLPDSEIMTQQQRREAPALAGALDVASELGSPATIGTVAATAGVGEAGVIPKVLSGLFAGQIATSVYDQYPALKDAVNRAQTAKTKEAHNDAFADAQRILTHMGADTVMGLLAAKHGAEGAKEILDTTTGSGVPDQASTFKNPSVEPALKPEETHPEMNRDTVKKLQNLGYSNQHITNFNIGEIRDILKNQTPAADHPVSKPAPAPVAPDKFAAAGGKLVGPSPKAAVSTPAETPTPTETGATDPIEDLIMSDKIGGKKVKGAPSKAKPIEPAGQNAAAGFIKLDGTFQELTEGSHPKDAEKMGTTVPQLRRQGWVRKAGQGSYDAGKLTPTTKAAIEHDILADYSDLKYGNEYGHPVSHIVIDTADGTHEIPVDDFIDKHNGSLDKAMGPEPEAFAEHGGKFVGKSPKAPTPSKTPVTDILEQNHGLTTDPTTTAYVKPNGERIGVKDRDLALDNIDFESHYPATDRGAAKRTLINQEGLVRLGTRTGRAGAEVYASVPPNVTPEQAQAIRESVGAMGRNGNLMIERADINSENAATISTKREFALPSHVDDALREIGAHPDQQDIVSKAKVEENPHKETYGMEVTNYTDGTSQKVSIDAHSPREALAKIKKQFPDAEEWRLDTMPEERKPSTTYEVPTGKRIKMPPSYNRPEEDTERHEVAHALVALKGGLQTGGVLSSHHPIVPSDARAVHLLKGAGLRDPATGRIREDKRTAVLASGLAGIASDEIQGVPRAANPNFFINEDGDGGHAYSILKAAGFSHEDALTEMHRLIDENVEYLKHPAYASVVNENVGAREKGLSRQFHYSPERLQNMHAEIERRKANGEPTTTDNRTSDEATAAGRESNVPGGEGEVSRTGEGQPQEGQITNAEKETNQPNLRNRPVVESNGETTSGRLAATGKSEAAPTEPAEIEKWQPPAGIEKGIPSTSPVDTEIPLTKLSVSPSAYSRASSDNARGKGSKTEGPIRVLYNPDNGQYLVEDGMHRLVQAHQNGETSIPAKLWSGYSDTVDNVHGDKMDLSPETEEGIVSEDKTQAAKDFEKVHEDYLDRQDQVATDIIEEYGQSIGKEGYRQQWDVVPAGRLKKIWTDYAKLGFVRDEKGIDQIADTVLENIHKIHVNNVLTGHSEEPVEDFTDRLIGEKHDMDYYSELSPSFFDDEKGNWRLSDYGAEPLAKGAATLMLAKTPEEKLQAIDHILNITHARSDLASWFVEGGTKTLNQLAGKRPEDIVSEEKVKKTKPAPEVSPNEKLQASAQKYAAAHDMPEINHEPVKADPEARPSTGGTPEAPAAPPIPKASESLPLVSTRMPSKTVKGKTIEEHTNGALTSDMQAATAAPGYLEKLADRVADTPGFKDPGGDATTRTNAYIRHIADNVKFVWSKLTPEAIKHDEQWYPVGAHERGIEVAKQHAIDPHQAYAVTAALSPLTDWDQNTSQAERAVNIWKNQQGTKFTPEMKQAGKDIASIPAMKKFASKFKKLEGKTLGELTGVRDQALWLRLYDEGHNSRAYQTWNPDGTPAGIAKNPDGSPKALGWSFQNLIEHAIDILKDGSQENISKVLGAGHKVRNFYNNQLAPDDPRFLTIDTHAVNIGQLRPMSGKTPAVRDNFGGISNKPYGLKGTYALHDAGYRVAAKELDIPIPSRLQSPTWVKIREVFPNKFKTPENQQAIDAIWKEHTDGKITIDDARNKIWDYAEGWNRRNAGGVGDTSDQGELFNVGLSGEPAGGAAGRGTGSDVAPANQEVAPEEDSSFNFGANVKPADARSRTSKISATQRAKNDAMVKGLAGLIKSGKK